MAKGTQPDVADWIYVADYLRSAIYGKYIDRSIYRFEDEHTFPFLQNYLGIEPIQSRQ